MRYFYSDLPTEKPKNLLDHCGKRTRDLWFSNLRTVLISSSVGRALNWQTKNSQRLDSHRGQDNFSAFSWLVTQSRSIIDSPESLKIFRITYWLGSYIMPLKEKDLCFRAGLLDCPYIGFYANFHLELKSHFV